MATIPFAQYGAVLMNMSATLLCRYPSGSEIGKSRITYGHYPVSSVWCVLMNMTATLLCRYPFESDIE